MNETWISCHERLPIDDIDGETVLAIVSGKPKENITLINAVMTAGYFEGEGWVINEYPDWESAKVDYWMPIPVLQGVTDEATIKNLMENI